VIHGIKQELPDSLNGVFEQELDLKWEIITDLKDELMTKAFSNLQSIEHY
jgi:hypothetical protein